MAKQPKIRYCKNCNAQLTGNPTICPTCGANNKTPIYKKWWVWLIVAIVLIGIAGNTNKENGSNSTEIETSQGVVNEETVVEENAPAGIINTEETAGSEGNSNVSTEYKNALKKAETYSSMMHMSRQGIYNQLTSEYGEGFPEDAAQYAIDNIEADWNKNALAKAEDYSKTMYMSKQGIYDQLTSEYGERFTADEAQYAIDNVKADWNENALKKAKTYQNTMSMSKSAIYDQLVSEYGEKFTADEAQYAIDNLE